MTPPLEPSSEIVTPPAPPAPAPSEYDIEVDENSPLSQEELEAIADHAGRFNLTKDEAQALVAKQESLYVRGKQTAEKIYNDKIESMKTAIKSHPDFSPDKKDATWTSINRALQTFGNDKLLEAFKDPENGYNLDIALFLKNIGDALGPEVLPGGGTSTVLPKALQDSEDARLRRAYPGLYAKEDAKK